MNRLFNREARSIEELLTSYVKLRKKVEREFHNSLAWDGIYRKYMDRDTYEKVGNMLDEMYMLLDDAAENCMRKAEWTYNSHVAQMAVEEFKRELHGLYERFSEEQNCRW